MVRKKILEKNSWVIFTIMRLMKLEIIKNKVYKGVKKVLIPLIRRKKWLLKDFPWMYMIKRSNKLQMMKKKRLC